MTYWKVMASHLYKSKSGEQELKEHFVNLSLLPEANSLKYYYDF